MKFEDELLHVYGQDYYHSEAYIVGNKKSLLFLKKAIEDAIETGRGTANFVASDGEGYSINIISREDNWSSEFWTKLAAPYFGEYAQDKRKDIIHPAEIWHSKNRTKS